jgi:hypothetical protein
MKPSVGHLASVNIRFHLNALKSAARHTASAYTPKSDMDWEVSRSLLLDD